MPPSKVSWLMYFAPRARIAGGIGCAVLLISACGSGGAGLLSGTQANSLTNQLTQISNLLGSGNCNGASSAAQTFVSEVNSLPGSVNATLRSNLVQGASEVQQLASTTCSSSSRTTSTSTSTSTTTSSTSSSPSTSSSSSSSSSSPTTTGTTTATTPSSSGTSTSGGAGLGTGTTGGGGP